MNNMSGVVFIFSSVLIIAASISVIKHKGDRILGLELTKKKLLMLVVFEFILLILTVIDFNVNYEPNSANDLMWYSMFSYYRGVWPIVAFMWLYDFVLPINNFIDVSLMFLSALLSDYLILFLLSILKRIIARLLL